MNESSSEASDVDSSGELGRLAAGATISVIGKVIGRSIDFGRQILLARWLGPELFGLYALCWNILRVIGIIAPLGLNNGVIHFGARFWQRDAGSLKAIFQQSVGVTVSVTTVISLVLFVNAEQIGNFFSLNEQFVIAFRYFVWVLPFMAGLRVAAAATRISRRMQFSIYAEEITQSLVAFGGFVFLYALGWGLLGAVWSTVLSFGIGFALALFYIRLLFPEIRQTVGNYTISTSTLLRFSFPTAMSGMFGVLINRFDRIFLGYYSEPSVVGIYQAASQFSVVFAIILDGFNSIFSPMIVDLYHSGRLQELENLYRINTKWGIYISAPLLPVLTMFSTEVMVATFGAEYASGSNILSMLIVGQFVNIATGAVGLLLMMTGRQNEWFLISCCMMIMNGVLNVLFIPVLGGFGAAIATTITISALFLGGLWRVNRVLHLWPYDRRYWKGAVALFGSTVALWVLSFVMSAQAAWLVVATAVVVSFGAFLTILWQLGFDEEDLFFLQMIMAKLKGNK